MKLIYQYRITAFPSKFVYQRKGPDTYNENYEASSGRMDPLGKGKENTAKGRFEAQQQAALNAAAERGQNEQNMFAERAETASTLEGEMFNKKQLKKLGMPGKGLGDVMNDMGAEDTKEYEKKLDGDQGTVKTTVNRYENNNVLVRRETRKSVNSTEAEAYNSTDGMTKDQIAERERMRYEKGWPKRLEEGQEIYADFVDHSGLHLTVERQVGENTEKVDIVLIQETDKNGNLTRYEAYYKLPDGTDQLVEDIDALMDYVDNLTGPDADVYQAFKDEKAKQEEKERNRQAEIDENRRETQELYERAKREYGVDLGGGD